MAKKIRYIKIRLDEETYQKLAIVAKVEKGDSISNYVRKQLTDIINHEIARGAKNEIASIVRSTIRAELKKPVDRLANLCSKSAISATSNENLTYLYLNQLAAGKSMVGQNMQKAKSVARSRAVLFAKKELDEIIQEYSGGEDE